MYKTNSINFKEVSIRDLIWIETSLLLDKRIEKEEKQLNFEILNDLRALIKDLDDVQRLSLTHSKSSILKWTDLPSQRKNAPELNPDVRKAFLKELSEKYKQKNK